MTKTAQLDDILAYARTYENSSRDKFIAASGVEDRNYHEGRNAAAQDFIRTIIERKKLTP